LEIARLLGWYRIPLRTAPKVVAVDYLAFYQPSTFGDHGGQIEFVSQVKGHELTTHAELLKDEADHPRAKEEYYKLQIGAMEKLSQPIKPGQDLMKKSNSSGMNRTTEPTLKSRQMKLMS